MHICGAKFQEHCYNISRDIFYSVFYHLLVVNHGSNLHNRKVSISLKRKKIFQKEKRHSFVFQNAFEMSRKKNSCLIHFKRASSTTKFPKCYYWTLHQWNCRLILCPFLVWGLRYGDETSVASRHCAWIIGKFDRDALVFLQARIDELIQFKRVSYFSCTGMAHTIR